MNYLFALLVLVALLVVAMAQWPYYGGYYGHGAAYPYAYNYGLYNPTYLWK